MSEFSAPPLIAISALPLEKAIQLLKSQSGYRYDPLVVKAFIEQLDEADLHAQRSREIKSRDLAVGMQLSEDLRNKEGMLLIVRDSIITENNIQQIRKFEQLEDIALQIYIKLSDHDA